MRSKDHIIQGKDRVHWIGRFLLQYIQTSPGNLFFLQDFGQISLVDNWTPCRIDQKSIGLHQGKQSGIHESLGSRIEITVDAKNIGFSKKLFQFDHCYIKILIDFPISKWIMCDVLHSVD